jgi:hypothetical protein
MHQDPALWGEDVKVGGSEGGREAGREGRDKLVEDIVVFSCFIFQFSKSKFHMSNSESEAADEVANLYQ